MFAEASSSISLFMMQGIDLKYLIADSSLAAFLYYFCYHNLYKHE